MKRFVLITICSVLFGLGWAAVERWRAQPKPLTVVMNGDESADLFVCGQLEPGTPTCLDMPEYVARVKAAQEAARHKREDM